MNKLVPVLVFVVACTAATDPDERVSTVPDAGVETTASTVPDGNPGGVGIGDRLYPTLGNSGYDVDVYDFSLTVTLDGRVSGRAQILLTPTEHLSQFNLDLSGLTVEDVTIAGFPWCHVAAGGS